MYTRINRNLCAGSFGLAETQFRKPFYVALFGLFYTLLLLIMFLTVSIRESLFMIVNTQKVLVDSTGTPSVLIKIVPVLVISSMVVLLQWILELTWDSALRSSFLGDPIMVIIAPAEEASEILFV